MLRRINPYLGIVMGNPPTADWQVALARKILPPAACQKALRHLTGTFRGLRRQNRLVSLGESWYLLDRGHGVDFIFVPKGGVDEDHARQLMAAFSITAYTLPWPEKLDPTDITCRTMPETIRRRWYKSA